MQTVFLYFLFYCIFKSQGFSAEFILFFSFDINFKLCLRHVFMIFLMAWLLIDRNIMFILFIYYLKMNFYLKTYKYRHLKIVYKLTVNYVI